MVANSDSPPHEFDEVEVEETQWNHTLMEVSLADQLSPQMTTKVHPYSPMSTCYHEIININAI